MNCPRCKAGNGPGAQYCGACGKALPEKAAPAPAPPKPHTPPAFDRPAFSTQRKAASPLATSLAHPWTGPAPASLAARAKAGFVDVVVLSVLLGIGGVFDEADPTPFFGLLFFWIYKAGFEWGKPQATPAKQKFGVKVVRLDGSRMSLRVATIRTIAWILSTMALGLGHALALMTPGRRAFHDLLCDTVVVPASFVGPPGGKTWEDEVKELTDSIKTAPSD